MPLTATDDTPWPTDAVEVGRIIGAWGVKGWIKVQPFATQPEALFSSKRWFIAPDASAPAGPPGSQAGMASRGLLKIAQAREHGAFVIAQAHDVADRNAAEALKGTTVFISRGSFPTPSKDEYYWVDLIGLQVFNAEGGAMGTVVGLLDTGPHSVLRV